MGLGLSGGDGRDRGVIGYLYWRFKKNGWL
jgi:hypothetical protein